MSGMQCGDAENEWSYGDAWQADAPEGIPPQDDGIVYVEVLRCDTGRGFDDSRMIGLIAYLGSRGIRATYDSFSLGLEPAAIKTYVLKVESGREEEALRCLSEQANSDNATE